jgi:hypothetical protein
LILNVRSVSLLGDFFRRSEGRVGGSQDVDQIEGVGNGAGKDEVGTYVSALGCGIGELGADDAGVETWELEERDQVAERFELDVDGREGVS